MTLLVFLLGVCAPPAEAARNPRVILKTTKGDITIELFEDKAPKTVRNFLEYVDKGFYDGTIFHRVIRGFMIQGGQMRPDMGEKPAGAPIQNEADNGLKNLRGTVAMARTPHPHSACVQFFINTKDNPFLDFRSPTFEGYGYCVFGRVIKGMDVVDAIERVPTTTRGFHQDVPVESVIIEKATRVAPADPKADTGKPAQ
ncbi:MAG TPA: peptidylprolyl isomerase [Deltaproteobacteria bacterium]|nr:peptidylprolyl isomerase [Deltaproteobacteria bacterium]HOM29265.1 peptidylprolyl isomerase [Deltaproteobacteria bacterium]HPP81344.1 peptidylprolyl isomerase [Deltaproteobacteria bacterium]